MTPTKILLAGAAMVSLLIMFATRPTTPAPPAEKDQGQVRTLSLAQMPFETPSWVPDEATKKKALLRAYELNGNSMVGDGRMIDVSKEDLTGHVTADAPAHAAAEVVDPNSRNALDAQADNQPDWNARRKFMNRTFRAIRDRDTQPSDIKSETDVCKRHGLHKVIYGDRWRCRK